MNLIGQFFLVGSLGYVGVRDVPVLRVLGFHLKNKFLGLFYNLL